MIVTQYKTYSILTTLSKKSTQSPAIYNKIKYHIKSSNKPKLITLEKKDWRRL